MQGSLDLYRRIDSAADKSGILGFLRNRSDVLSSIWKVQQIWRGTCRVCPLQRISIAAQESPLVLV